VPTLNTATQNLLMTIITAIAVSGPAFSQGQAFDPTGYLQRQEFEQKPAGDQAIQEGVVVMGGVTYYKFENASGAIYVPKLTDLTEADFEKALCANRLPSDNPMKTDDGDKATVAAAEAKASERVTIYSKLIVTTINKKCGGAASEQSAGIPAAGASDLEVGVKVNTGTERRPSSTTIFNTNLLPNIGVRNEF
jgi:hypothetical protein